MKTRRKNLSFIFVLSLILTLCISIIPVQAATTKSGKVAVTVPKTTLYVGDSRSNSTPITVKYNNKTVKSGIKYSTSNKKIATVKKGKIVASRKGTATISVRYKNKTCRFKITVKNATLNLSKKSLSLQKSKTYTFKAYANKTQLKATSVKWTTSNKKIVSVNKNGTIKALKNGKAVITAKTSFGTAKCTVTVSSKPAHQHTWVDHTATKKVPRTVHHDAVYETVTIPAVTKHQIQCLGCGQWFDSLDALEWHQVVDTNGECGNYDGHCERDVVITPAHTEQKLVKEAYDETVYDTQTYVDYQYCSGCGQHK
ncbi:Ig-like domain-containing protein [Blautia sp. Sow4_E7]|uniref:Ig-like domain-containing protein n=1 Tax=Blautia sp. Sow4_E7 TaxID=3438749 RepID=UPI003F8F6159